MEKGLKDLLESSILSEENKVALQEAWNQKLDEIRANVREEESTKLREEFASRFSTDKNDLLEAMNLMLTGAITEHAEEKAAELKALKEDRARLTQTIKEARANAKALLSSKVKAFESFSMGKLVSEMTEFNNERKALEAQRVELAEKTIQLESLNSKQLAETIARLESVVEAKLGTELSNLTETKERYAQAVREAKLSVLEHKKRINEQAKESIKLIESYVSDKLKKELNEFQIDRKQLVADRVKFVSESTTKLEEAKKSFIERATRIVESSVSTQLKRELSQLKEDLVEARQNTFGRRLFEAFSNEFMTSSLSEGSQSKELAKKLAEAQSIIAETAAAKTEQELLVETLERKVKFIQAKAQRERTLNELMSPLSREKRALMGKLLESTKTSALQEAFGRMLPSVLGNESPKSSPQKGRQIISESPVSSAKTTSVHTGNRTTTVTESARAVEEKSSDNDEFTADIVRLAGIKK